MLILGIETSTPHSSVCLSGEDGVVASASLGAGRRHGEFVTPAIRFCLDQAGTTREAITGVAVGVGPGLYTGLRVGLVSARTIAAALHLPMVGLSGLDVLAFQVRHVRRLICATIDARRGEVFWCFYRSAPGGVQRDSDLRVGGPQTLAAEIDAAGEECLLVGDGARRYAEVLHATEASLGIAGTSWPLAVHLTELAIPRFVREETRRPDEIRALYLRQADAKIGWETRGRLRGGEG